MALSKSVTEMRRQFRDNYSSQTANIIKRLAKGQSCSQIADALDVSVGTVGTTKGNLTRGLYTPYAYVVKGNVQGSCDFAS